MATNEYKRQCHQQAAQNRQATRQRHSQLIELIRPLAGKLSSAQIGQQLGVSASFIRTLAMRHDISLARPRRNAITPDDYVLIQQLEATGMSNMVICEKFECTELELELAHLHYGG